MALKIGLILLQTTIILASPQGPNASGYGSAPTSSAAPPSSGSSTSGSPNGTQPPSSSGYGGFNNGPGYVNPGGQSTTTGSYGQQQSSTPSYGGGTMTNGTTPSNGTNNTSSTTPSSGSSNTTSPRPQCQGQSGCNPPPQCGQPGQSNNPACATTPSYGGSTPSHPPSSQAYGVPGHTPGAPIGPIFTDPNQPNFSEVVKSTCAQQNPSYNRDLVIKAHQQVFGDRNPQNINNYFAESYIEHDPSSPDASFPSTSTQSVDVRRKEGRNGIVDTLKNNNATQRFSFLRTCADADLVWVHNRVELKEKVFAAVDIYRIECGVIKEHWGVRQDAAIDGISGNGRSFF